MGTPVLALPPETADSFRKVADSVKGLGRAFLQAFGLPTFLLGPPMSERDAFLASIKAAWNEDTPRLAFADWLDEHGEVDRDRATAEFIRVSCDNRTGGRKGGPAMPKRAYRWLFANWSRLVPKAAALHVGTNINGVFTVGARPSSYPRGRVIHAQWRLPVGSDLFPGETRIGHYNIRLSFCRGFLEVARLYCPTTQGLLTLPLAADQPFAVFPQNRPAPG